MILHTREKTIVRKVNVLIYRLFLHVRPNYIHSTSDDIHTEGARAKTGGHSESGETGDSREEEDTQWRQVITLYTRIPRTFAGSAYFMKSYMK